jgi:multiple sugar transport system ATP-binding protein
MATITLENIGKKFNDQLVLSEIDLSIDEGEFVVFVGPSGCGKTTLLRLIAGLEDVTSGKILIGSEDVTWIEAKNRGVGMVFQNYALYPHLTVKQNLAYPLNILKFSKPDKEQRINEVAQMLEIQSLLKRKPAELSGGQRQRVAIGRALARRPDIFLFDEPLSNLDARLREQMRLEIAELHKELGRTTIYVTHDQHEAMTLGDRLVIMNEGKIIQEGKPFDLYTNPRTLFVAKFTGSPSMNLVSGELSGQNHFESVLGRIDLTNALKTTEKSLYMGIRPEEVQLKKLKDNQTSTNINGKVTGVEQLGREVHLVVTVNNEKLRVVSGQSEWEVGEQVEITLPEEQLLWFSKETEQRLF